MPNTPQVKFTFQNNNVQPSVPLLGVSHVIARTTMGPFKDPSTLLSSYAQFQRLFGEEIVPDGTVSNIQKAFELGSRLRVSRVMNDGVSYGYAQGTAGESAEDPTTKPENPNFQITLTNPEEDSDESIIYKFWIRTKNMGEQIFGSSDPFNIVLSHSKTGSDKLNLAIYNTDGIQVDSRIVISWSGGMQGNTQLEYNIQVSDFINFISNVPYLALETEGTKTMDQIIMELQKKSNWILSVQASPDAGGAVTTLAEGTSRTWAVVQGSLGGDSVSLENTQLAIDALADYNDAYQVAFSHIDQWLTGGGASSIEGISQDCMDAYNYWVTNYAGMFEAVLYVEVPPSVASTAEDLLEAVKKLIPAVGYKKNIAYFGGGIKYYNDNGILQNCSVMGTILGLGDTVATSYGPWYSFAGMNRGIVTDAQGSVIENLGAPSKVEVLQQLAEWYTNIFVIKDTPTAGKRTMLWHNFTSNPINDSEKFLSIVRLNLYLKKNLRPILESYLEEPNTFSTWQDIYQEAKDKVLDPLLGTAMTTYTWLGDQDASSYDELQVNTEADVRQGKYKVVLRYEDIVPLQEVTINIVIDAASQSISIDTEE